MKKFKVILYEKMAEAGTRLLQEHCRLVYPQNLDEATLIQEAKDADAIVIRANGRVSKAIIDAAARLKVIGRHGVGVENIDIEAATNRGIWVVNTPNANTESVAEHTVGFIVALSKRMLEADKAIRQGRFEVRYEYFGQEILGKTLGIIGLGRIGGRVAEICHLAFKMKVIYYDEIDRGEMAKKINARSVPFEEVLKEADYLSLHIPSTPKTHHLVGEKELRLMKRSAFLINTSRGPIVDEAALIQALKKGWIKGAGLDVYEEEPASKDNPLFQLSNVVVTPHMAAHTHEALAAMSLVAEDVLRVLSGKSPRYPVNQVKTREIAKDA
jgi:D-3-phosphoglycerate dehydrogenase